MKHARLENSLKVSWPHCLYMGMTIRALNDTIAARMNEFPKKHSKTCTRFLTLMETFSEPWGWNIFLSLWCWPSCIKWTAQMLIGKKIVRVEQKGGQENNSGRWRVEYHQRGFLWSDWNFASAKTRTCTQPRNRFGSEAAGRRFAQCRWRLITNRAWLDQSKSAQQVSKRGRKRDTLEQ